MKTLFRTCLLIPLFSTSFVNASGITETEDTRQRVEMPEEAVTVMRSRMQGMLTNLNLMINELSMGNYEQAATIAENNIGTAASKHHKARGAIMPGRFMPPEMRTFARGVHKSADEFARVARKGNAAESLQALNAMVSNCVACHASFRVR